MGNLSDGRLRALRMAAADISQASQVEVANMAAELLDLRARWARAATALETLAGCIHSNNYDAWLCLRNQLG